MNANVMLRFTSTARKALNNAMREAQLERASGIDTRHLLIGLVWLSPTDSSAAHILNGLDITPEKLNAIAPDQAADGETPPLALSDGVRRTLERAATAAQQRDDSSLGSAHLLAGILDDADAARLLESLGAPGDRVRAALDSLQIWTDEV
jgi:ATP-dependent Clp protease ATP-binding subunit ClpA